MQPTIPLQHGVQAGEEPSTKIRWRLAGLLLAIVFLIATWGIHKKTSAPQWDGESFFAPAYTLIADHARAARILLWNPWQSGGSPDYAEPELGVASPLTVTIGAVTGGTSAGFRIYWVLIWFLGPLGMLFLARHLGAPPWAGFVVALGFAFSGFYTGNAEHFSSIYSISFLPWFLWRLDASLATGRIKPAVEAGALWGLSALAGYPQLTILSGVFLFLWTFGRLLFSSSDERRSLQGNRFLHSAVALAMVLLVGVVVLAPSYVAIFWEGTGYSDRVGVRPREQSVGSNATEVSNLLTFASPYLTTLQVYGNPRLWPGTHVSMSNVYLGAVTTILAILAMIDGIKISWRWWLFGIAIFFMACAVGKQLPVRGWLYDYFPPTRYFRNPGLFRVYTMFCAEILALLGAKDLEGRLRVHNGDAWRKFLFAGMVASIAATVSYIYVFSRVEELGNRFQESSIHLVLVWVGSMTIASLPRLLPKALRAAPLLLMAVAIFDAAEAIRLAKPTIYSTGPVREVVVWNWIDQYHRSQLDLTGRGLKRESSPPVWIGGHENNENLPLKVPTFFNYATLTNRFQIDFANHRVLEGMSTGTDRIWFSEQAAVLPPTDTFYRALVEQSEALNAPVLLVHPPADMPKIRELELTTAMDIQGVSAVSRLAPAQRVAGTMVRYEPDYLELDVTCPQNGWLLVTDRWSRGWRATVNGQPAQIFGGNFIFRAVQVRAGGNKVQFRYSPAGWPILLVLSWGTLALVAVSPFISPWRFRN